MSCKFSAMGFLSRLFVPRKVRRALHPVRSAKRVVRKAVVPKAVRRATYAASQLANPVSAVKYHGIERPLPPRFAAGQRSPPFLGWYIDTVTAP